jgi:hypothetical protein
MKPWSSLIAMAASVALLAACGDTPPPRPRSEPEKPRHPPTAMLTVYAAPDGSLTRAQMEAGLKRDFDKLDTHHTGSLNEDQVRAIDEQRWKEDESTASPLIDFKHNGCVDFDEFAAAPRSLFDQLDRDGNGRLSPQELGKPKPTATPPEHGPPPG